MFESLIDDLQAKWRNHRLSKGLYDYVHADEDRWRFLLIKGQKDECYHFVIFIQHEDNQVEIEGELTEDEQIMKEIMDEMTRSGWTMIGLEVVERMEEINPCAIILSRLDISPPLSLDD